MARVKVTVKKMDTATEHITHEAGNDEAWICICKNTPVSDGFYPCNKEGIEVEPTAEWDGLYVCAKCGRIIKQNSLEVIGSRA
jgi:hypothetical protein